MVPEELQSLDQLAAETLAQKQSALEDFRAAVAAEPAYVKGQCDPRHTQSVLRGALICDD